MVEAMSALASPWAESVDRSLPLPEYPRPSLVRHEWLCLNGSWDCAVLPAGEPPGAYADSILVPFPVEAPLSGIGRHLGPSEELRYRRSFVLPASWRGRRIMLHFEAVDWEARVLVNGGAVGEHRGGYDPFGFDVTEYLLAGDAAQELVVAVRDPTDSGTQCRGKQVGKPGGIWYTAASGIWGSVWLEPVPEAYIARVVAGPAPGSDPSEGRLLVKVALGSGGAAAAGGGAPERRIRATLSAGGEIVAAGETLASGAEAAIELAVPDPRPWSPESPFLYGLCLELEGGDRVESYAALRTVELRSDEGGRGRVFLNGKRYFNNAVLDQGYWPEGIYTAPTDEALASDILRAKELGFNTIRKHAKVERERWYWHCDRLGMLVWQDIPSGGEPMRFLFSAILGFLGVKLRDDRFPGRFGRASRRGREEFEREAMAIVDYLEGFSCIVAWVPFNEGWGQFESSRVAAEIARRDPTRLVDAASGWYENGGGDFASRHDYSAKPRSPRAGGRRDSADHGSAAPRAAALTEFGGLTLRVAGHSTEDKRQFGYRGARDGEELAARYEALAARLAALAREGLAASVYTQICDVEIERNGLLTYDRAVIKASAERIAAANRALTAAGSE